MKSICCACNEYSEVDYIPTPSFLHTFKETRFDSLVGVPVCRLCQARHGKPVYVRRNNLMVMFEDGFETFL